MLRTDQLQRYKDFAILSQLVVVPFSLGGLFFVLGVPNVGYGGGAQQVALLVMLLAVLAHVGLWWFTNWCNLRLGFPQKRIGSYF